MGACMCMTRLEALIYVEEGRHRLPPTAPIQTHNVEMEDARARRRLNVVNVEALSCGRSP